MAVKKTPDKKSSEIRDDVKKLIAQIARINVRKVKEIANIRDDLGIDSLAAMEILASVEKRLGIVIDEAKAFDVVTVNDLLDLVTQCLRKKKRL